MDRAFCIPNLTDKNLLELRSEPIDYERYVLKPQELRIAS